MDGAGYDADRRSLVEAAFAGEAGQRPLVSLWRHWPKEDQDARSMADAHLAHQRRFDFDFVKFTPSGTDLIEDWGARTAFSGDPHGTRDVVQRGVQAVSDWERVQPFDLSGTRLGAQIDAIRAIRAGLGPTVPLFQTVFGPLTIARKLAGDRVAGDLRHAPSLVRRALAVIADQTARFVAAAFDAGADGLFFATQAATRDLLTDDEHLSFGAAFDRPLLEAARRRTALITLHAHGSSLIYEHLLDYPVSALNWHDRAVGPSIAEMRGRFPGLLMGGIDEWGCLLDGPVDAIRAQVADAVRQAGGRPFCVAAGCVIGYRTATRNVRAVRAAVRR